jgi:Tudor domain
MIKDYDPRTLTFEEQKALKLDDYKVCVSHLDAESMNFYVQLHSQVNTVVKFYNDILKDFSTCSLKFPSLGNACFVRFKDNFYRGQIMKRITSSIWRVRIIDYGFDQDFLVGDIQVLVGNFVKDPPCAYKCCLFSYDVDQMALISADDGEPVKMIIKSVQDGAYCVELVPIDEANEKEESLISEDSSMTSNKSSNISSQWGFEPDSDMKRCKLASVESTKFFTIQRDDDKYRIKVFQEAMQLAGIESKVKGPLPIAEVVQMKLFLVINPETNLWCRVFVHEIRDGHFLMKDIDTGAKFPVSKQAVYLAPVKIKTQIPFAISCSLPCRVKKNQKRAAYEYLQNLRGCKLMYKLVFADEFTNIVELYDEKNRNVVNEMVGLNIVAKLLAPPSGTCYITYVHSLSDFYIMLKSDDEYYNKTIKEFCVERYEPIKADKIEKGMKVMAKYSKDGAWYRAKIIDTIEDKFEVFYIDFGNKSVVGQEDIGLVDESYQYILKTRSLIVKCSLNLPKYNPSSERAVQYLIALANKGFREFVYETVKSGKKSIVVRLKDTKGRDVADWSKLCEPADKDKIIKCASETESGDSEDE